MSCRCEVLMAHLEMRHSTSVCYSTQQVSVIIRGTQFNCSYYFPPLPPHTHTSSFPAKWNLLGSVAFLSHPHTLCPHLELFHKDGNRPVTSLNHCYNCTACRVLHAWSYIVRRRSSQRRLGEKFARLRQHRQVASAFMTMRSRFDYCQGLKEAADSMCAKRDRNLAKVAMGRWKVRILSFSGPFLWDCTWRKLKTHQWHAWFSLFP